MPSETYHRREGYVFVHEWGSRDGALSYFVDWESAADTVDEVVDYVREWKDGSEGEIRHFTATLEPVASVVWPERPEECEAVSGQQSLFT